MSGQRRSALLMVAVLLLACALLALTGRHTPSPAGTPATTSTRREGSATGKPNQGLTVVVRRSVLAFTRSYLAYAYNANPAIVDATPAFRRRLLSHPPRIAATGGRRPRVLWLHLLPAGSGAPRVQVLIGDGLLRYQLRLRLVTGGDGPLVAALDGAGR